MIVSPFTPLCFDAVSKDGILSDYIQTFSTSDRLLLQLIGRPAERTGCVARVIDALTETAIFDVVFNEWEINEETLLLFSSMSFSPGFYRIVITGIGASDVFRVTDDAAELDETCLIQYSMKDNRRRRDAVFFIDGMHYFFDFRVPGGFRDRDWSFGVESEQFVTQYSDIVQLYNLDSTQRKFTLGTSVGVPVWFGQMLNRLLVCNYVYFDGVRYARKESNVPELAVQLDGVNSFVFTQTLQQVHNLDPVIESRNHMILRRVTGVSMRSADSKLRTI